MRVIPGLLLCAVCASAAVPSFTLEQVLSAPFPSELVSDGNQRLAWVQNASGIRNIWAAEGPSFRSRRVTDFASDDGQELSELAISSTGEWLLFTRGEGPNASGESPNPAHLAAGAEQTIIAVPFAGGAAVDIGKGHSPAISPDGHKVVFVSAGQVWIYALGSNGKAAQLLHVRGAAESLEWSPDGKQLAFVSSRGNHSFVAVFGFDGNSVRYLDPSTDSDSNPVWSPDGKQIAFIRQQVVLDELEFAPHREDQQPWSIRVADVSAATGKQIWQAQAGMGSHFREISGHHQIRWAAGNQVILPWERTGWLHLYSVSLSGAPARELTPGDFEVEQISLSPDRKQILYSSNQDDIDRRHVWTVGLDGSRPKRLTSGGDIEWGAQQVGSAVGLFHSDFRSPARAALVSASATSDLAEQTIPKDFPAAALPEPLPVVFPAADGLELHGQLFLPCDGKQRHPAVIFFHGGSRRQMLLGWHYMFYYNQAYGFNQYLASKGYVVLSVNYRSGIGMGLQFREALHYGANGASEFNDVLGAGLFLRSRSDVNPAAIGLWGGSYGGFLTALGLARASDLFAAGVDLHGVHEWSQEMSGSVPDYEPERRESVVRTAFLSSPLAYVETWRSPVLLIHGDDDRNVNFKQSIMLAQALRSHKVEFEELVFPDEIHDFLTHQHWLEAYHAAEQFLTKHLTQ